MTSERQVDRRTFAATKRQPRRAARTARPSTIEGPQVNRTLKLLALLGVGMAAMVRSPGGPNSGATGSPDYSHTRPEGTEGDSTPRRPDAPTTGDTNVTVIQKNVEDRVLAGRVGRGGENSSAGRRDATTRSRMQENMNLTLRQILDASSRYENRNADSPDASDGHRTRESTEARRTGDESQNRNADSPDASDGHRTREPAEVRRLRDEIENDPEMESLLDTKPEDVPSGLRARFENVRGVAWEAARKYGPPVMEAVAGIGSPALGLNDTFFDMAQAAHPQRTVEVANPGTPIDVVAPDSSGVEVRFPDDGQPSGGLPEPSGLTADDVPLLSDDPSMTSVPLETDQAHPSDYNDDLITAAEADGSAVYIPRPGPGESPDASGEVADPGMADVPVGSNPPQSSPPPTTRPGRRDDPYGDDGKH